MKTHLAALLLVLPSLVSIVPALADWTPTTDAVLSGETFAEEQTVAENDKRIFAEQVEYSSSPGNGTIRGYLAFPWRQTNQVVRAPAGLTGRRRPGVLVVHDNRGLTPQIEELVRRLAADNFIAFAPDAQDKRQEDLIAATVYLKNRPECTGTIGVVGFNDGGSMATMLATLLPDLTAAVSLDGGVPNADDVTTIRAALMIQAAGEGQRIDARWPANLAWQRTVDFLRRYLRS